ncbi:hypothetical protein AVEN_120215-1 [Araneus ventricosus]|uniref:Uncharacterized protein n=1 Tax=Araneus ventricosus TaxID=182803 RepID=A0A4Y2J6X5_ARAVE|nr:hypothetical protein AVEN_120215-1 [Araneus ventricosus]
MSGLDGSKRADEALKMMRCQSCLSSVSTTDEQIVIVKKNCDLLSKNCCRDCKICCVKRLHDSAKHRPPDLRKAKSRLRYHDNAQTPGPSWCQITCQNLTFRYFHNQLISLISSKCPFPSDEEFA